MSRLTRTILGMTVDASTDIQVPEAGQLDGARPVYLDCNATTPVDPRVQREVMHYVAEEFGNAGSRTHTYGQAAKERVNLARRQVADVVRAKPEEVIFTSGATESNNLALLGLAAHGERTGRRHIISTQIEHKAVLEPLAALAERGFDITLLPPTRGGWVDPEAVQAALRPDTLLVSIMTVNNETGVIQPIDEMATLLGGHDAYLHTDAAQAFGKVVSILQSPRIDLISISGHKIYATKGVGALIARRRGYKRVPLQALMYGGGQERGLRPGTLPVGPVAGLGLASELALAEHEPRKALCRETKVAALRALEPLGVVLNGDPIATVDHTLSFSIPGIDAEAALVAVRGVAALSNGSACTSSSYEPSHVLVAAGLCPAQVAGALRVSWSHMTPEVNWEELARRLARLM